MNNNILSHANNSTLLVDFKDQNHENENFSNIMSYIIGAIFLAASFIILLCIFFRCLNDYKIIPNRQVTDIELELSNNHSVSNDDAESML